MLGLRVAEKPQLRVSFGWKFYDLNQIKFHEDQQKIGALRQILLGSFRLKSLKKKVENLGKKLVTREEDNKETTNKLDLKTKT